MLSDPERRQHLRRVSATRACAPAAWAPRAEGFGSFEDVFDAFFGGGDPRSATVRFGRAGPAAAATSRAGSSSTLEEVLDRRQSARSPSRRSSACERCRGNGAEPGTPIRDLRDLRRHRPAPRGGRQLFGQLVRASACDRLRRPGQDPGDPVRASAAARAAIAGRGPGRSTSRPGSSPASGSGSRAPATPASPAGAQGDLYVEVLVADDERFDAPGTDLVTSVEVPATTAMLGGKVDRRRRSTASASVEVPAGAQPGEHVVLRGQRPAVAARRAPRRPARGPRRRRPGRARQRAAGSAERWTRRSARRADGGRRVALASAARPELIRLAVRCRSGARRAGARRASLELAPGGVEEERGPGWVEYAIYGAARRAARVGELEAAAGGEPGRGHDRPRSRTTGPTAGRTSTGRSWSAGASACARPGGSPKDGLIDVVVDPGQAFGTGAHPDHAALPGAAGRAGGGGRGRRAARRLGHRARACSRSPPRSSGWSPVTGLRPRAGGARGRGGERRGERRRARARARQPARGARAGRRRPWSPT